MRLFLQFSLNRSDGLLYLGRTCERKRQHATAVLATRAAYALEEQKPGERFDVYHCDYCVCWHVGHARED